jgi:sensor histidine kinase YesM
MRALITIINSETFIKIIVVITIILFCVVAFWTGSRLADRYQASQIDWEQRAEIILENIIEKQMKQRKYDRLELVDI